MKRTFHEPKRLVWLLLVLVGLLVLCSACNSGMLFLALFS